MQLEDTNNKETIKYNLVNIPLSSHFISSWNCIDSVRRNSYLVTPEIDRVKPRCAKEVSWIQISILYTVYK